MTHEYERFSYYVEDYFDQRETYPIIVSYKSSAVTEEDIEDLQNQLFSTYHEIDCVEVIATEALRGEFWWGALIELSWSEQDERQRVRDGRESLHSLARDIHEDFRPETHPQHSELKSGRSAYASACLESLGKEYFRI